LEGETKKNLFSFWNRLYSTLWKRDVTQEDIETLIDTVQSTGILDEEENEMIHRIFDLKDMVVREVMVPRTEIKALEVGVPGDEVAALVVEAGHSRLPVYEGTIDKIVGVIYAKDLLKHWVNKGKDIKTVDLMRKPLFVPETKSFGELLQELKSMRIHLAIVVDEYGGTSGLVTIEDLIEEIVGDIQDEHDKEEEEFVEIQDGIYLVDAKMDIEELAEKLDVEISHLSNKIPVVNEEIRYETLLFTITEADERKISKVKISLSSESEPEESALPARES
jgi:CBS domain containing-hemolysin-like protein